MAAAWETIMVAIDAEDYSLVTSTLLAELSYTNSLELLPFLRGVLLEVVKQEEAALSQSAARRAKKGSAFDRYNKPNQRDGQAGEKDLGLSIFNSAVNDELEGSAEPVQKEDPSAPSRRWRRAMRAMFNSEAAMALQDDMVAAYKKPEFAQDCRHLDDLWAQGKLQDVQKMTAINDLCKPHMYPVIVQYGFPGDDKGVQEVTNIVDAFATTVAPMRAKKREIQQLVLQHFQSLQNFAGPGVAAEEEPALRLQPDARAQAECFVCLHGHVMQDAINRQPGINCHKCQDRFRHGATMWSCSRCDYHVCAKCCRAGPTEATVAMLLQAACPAWTASRIASVEDSLRQVQIEDVDDLLLALKDGRDINEQLRGLMRFSNATLQALQNTAQIWSQSRSRG
eukprot:gnl/TRDRNA2_/TRDRNA2_194569_c0_seq1.p1 gnl/TRDRNA2_/TRDRNA2_194569_c0~~gnl/TRDRNA2_/TRDRNA2_194569_c0_seq1.p1  ORF type:complete len:409 (+),score=87.74 gnl/TRDRNA2_/TRDRNA2_194569_c0_seq1:43-1227(+)